MVVSTMVDKEPPLKTKMPLGGLRVSQLYRTLNATSPLLMDGPDTPHTPENWPGKAVVLFHTRVSTPPNSAYMPLSDGAGALAVNATSPLSMDTVSKNRVKFPVPLGAGVFRSATTRNVDPFQR